MRTYMDFITVTSEITENNQLRVGGSPSSDGVRWQVIAFLMRSPRDLSIKKISIFPRFFFHKICLLQSCLNFEHFEISSFNANTMFLMQISLKHYIFETIGDSNNFEAKNIWTQNNFEKQKYF